MPRVGGVPVIFFFFKLQYRILQKHTNNIILDLFIYLKLKTKSWPGNVAQCKVFAQ